MKMEEGKYEEKVDIKQVKVNGKSEEKKEKKSKKKH